MAPWEIASLVIGILGAICIGVFSIPGLVRIVKTKDSSSASLTMYIILAMGGLLFIITTVITMAYTNNISQLGIAIGNLASMACALAIISIKVRNIKNAKHNGMSEKQWCDKLALDAKIKKTEIQKRNKEIE